MGIINRCVRTGYIGESNRIQFHGNIGGVGNPLLRRIFYWPGRIGVTIEVMDADVKHDDHVDTLHRIITLDPSNNAWIPFYIKNRVEMYFQAKVYCGSHYYGPQCTMYCKRSRDSTGHYDCDSKSGQKLCVAGYTGTNCNIVINNCNPNRCQKGGTCHNLINSFTCSCPPGVKGNQCEQDVNECLNQDACSHGDCVNTLGSFACRCHTGYTGQTCEADINECDSSPCQNGATCINSIGDFLCYCSAGLTGIHCDNDIDECDELNLTCYNGTSCVNIMGSYDCQCPSGYTGPMCEADVDECLINPCHHNSTCVNLLGQYLCECEQGYTGVNCEENIDECLNGTCKNGANCTDLDGSFSCVCSSFWQGQTCEEDVNECLSDPCKNGGTCVNINDGFLCACPNEFVGSLCEEDRNECDLEETCENNSTCINSFGSFTCECLEGWSGRRCKEDINECETIPCSNFGTCINTPGGHHCQCPIHWTGIRCEEEVEECAPELSPCRNNATCLNLTDSYHCECEQGWAGELCSEDLNECLEYEEEETCGTIEDGTDREHSKVDHSLAPSHRVCMNTSPGFVCVCSGGWAGQDCDIDVDKTDPFYLSCNTTENWTINEDLKQIFLDTKLFQGKEINISHTIGPDSSTKGQVVTSSIYPIVTVDDMLMSVHEAAYVINKVSDKIKDTLHCSIVLNITQRTTIFITYSEEESKDWFPWLLAVLIMLVIAVAMLITKLHWRRLKSQNPPNKNQNRFAKASTSFNCMVYKEFNLTDPRVQNLYESPDFIFKHQNNTALPRTEIINDNVYEEVK